MPISLVRTEPYLLSKALRGVLDVGTWVLTTILAFVLLFDGRVPTETWSTVWVAMAGLVSLKLLATLVFRLHRQSWVKLAFRDARRIVMAMVAAGAAAMILAALAAPVVAVPLSVVAIDTILTVLTMLGTRSVARSLDEVRVRRMVPGRKARNVLMIGAGEAGAMLAREMLRHPETGMRPVGFIDDDAAKLGRSIASVPVLGRLDDLASVLEHEHVDEVLITIPSANGRAIRAIVDRIRAADPSVVYRTMPALHELLSGHVGVTRIRDVGIEDLLRRQSVKLDTDGIQGYLTGKRVMVTGAGGSIGSELVRQICRFAPGELILFGHGENSIYQLERELDRDKPNIVYHSIIGAVQNIVRLEDVFRRYRPDVVFHTAAHKHVPLMERNPEEAVFNNIIGSRNLVNLSLKYGVSHFVNVSTDKAVNPTSVMGASKRIVELIVENASKRADDGQVFVSVRFGNVLGSRGSAIPVFKDQIRSGGPVTVTHPDMVRFFMTIPEASQLVLQASSQGKNGEIYILDMGEPVRVLDLARDLIRLSGFEPDVDIPIAFTGVRPGEKLFEELMTEDEKQNRTDHEKIFVARSSSASSEAIDRLVNALTEAAMRSDGETIRRLLAAGARTSPKTLVDVVLPLPPQLESDDDEAPAAPAMRRRHEDERVLSSQLPGEKRTLS